MIEVLVFISFIFIPLILIWMLVWAIENERYKRTTPNGIVLSTNDQHSNAQPVVRTTANVIYTIPTNDPGRFPSTNISTTLRHHYDLPPSYDQVVVQSTTIQTPQPQSAPPTPAVHVLPNTPPPPFSSSSSSRVIEVQK